MTTPDRRDDADARQQDEDRAWLANLSDGTGLGPWGQRISRLLARLDAAAAPTAEPVAWRGDADVRDEIRKLIHWLRGQGAPLAPAEIFVGFDDLCDTVAALYASPRPAATREAMEAAIEAYGYLRGRDGNVMGDNFPPAKRALLALLALIFPPTTEDTP